MKLKLTLALVPLLTAVSCSEHLAFSGTELERIRMEVSDRVTLHDLITDPDFDNSSETMLRTAAFEMTKNLRMEQAVSIFEADGATCRQSACIWAERVREPFGVTLYPAIRYPGLRRTSDRFRQVMILSDVVTTPDDITVQSWSREVTESK